MSSPRFPLSKARARTAAWSFLSRVLNCERLCSVGDDCSVEVEVEVDVEVEESEAS